jgi:ATP-dependent Clp protease ATP-binding subunit ClpB
MTSNIGARELLEGIDEDGNIKSAAQDEAMNELKAHFRPEFLNRLDEIIMFKPLTKDNISGIVSLIMNDLNRRLAEREISVELSPEAVAYIIDNAYDPIYGARPLKRFIQRNVETLSAKLILEGNISEGDVILIRLSGDELEAVKKS